MNTYQHTWRAYRLEDQHIQLEPGDELWEAVGGGVIWHHIDNFTAEEGWELVNVTLMSVGGDVPGIAFFRRAKRED